MKKLLKLCLPALILLGLYSILSKSNYILSGIYFLFPLTFIVQSLIIKNNIKELLVGLFVSSVAFIVPINMFYSMGSCVELLIFYILLALNIYFIKERISSKKTCKD